MRFIAFVSSVAIAGVAQAGFVDPLIPSWAGNPNSRFAQWESFSQPNGGANVADVPTSVPYSLFNFSPGATLSGGNIVGTGGPLFVQIMGWTIGNAAMPTDVVLNVATDGTSMNAFSVRMTIFDNAGNSMQFSPGASALRFNQPTASGAAQNWAFTWSLPAFNFQASGFRVEFGASQANMTLDAVRLDLNYAAVPGPGVIAASSLVCLGARRRRR